ncbi:MAG TPA: hypothetical protein VFF60_00510 [Candidatus Binatus sp.]|nr:hypothetical protein [Candidatus Binatus sp.]
MTRFAAARNHSAIRSTACAATAGIAVAAVSSGASRALVAIPPAFVLCLALFCGALALRRGQTKASALWIFVGAIAGMLLPTALPVEHVLTRAAVQQRQTDLFRLLDALDASPHDIVGTRASISGTWTSARSPRAASVSRRIMTCCAADSVDLGLDVIPSQRTALPDGEEVCATGFVAARLDAGELRYSLVRASVRTRTCR